ncbi:hypothetical protein MASR1M36_07780 [Candidatus Cloacimonadaceae bacterium]
MQLWWNRMPVRVREIIETEPVGDDEIPDNHFSSNRIDGGRVHDPDARWLKKGKKASTATSTP